VGTDEYNYALALKRAKSVKESLATYGVDSSRIMIVSFGESNPACKESNKACWDKNRRAEFKLLP
jgi:peptidoglycan-associated lipoprotein